MILKNAAVLKKFACESVRCLLWNNGYSLKQLVVFPSSKLTFALLLYFFLNISEDVHMLINQEQIVTKKSS